jgi:hypothetical protein
MGAQIRDACDGHTRANLRFAYLPQPSARMRS